MENMVKRIFQLAKFVEAEQTKRVALEKLVETLKYKIEMLEQGQQQGCRCHNGPERQRVVGQLDNIEHL